MCGIAVWFAYGEGGRKCDRDELIGVRDSMRDRGPDGCGLWLSPDARLGFAHRRLAIIDLSDAGTQPMVSDDGFCRIVFNGEIYNYAELRRDLEKIGRSFRSNSDTEVLLHLYATKGFEMLRDLRGMFAFALWDERNKRLFVARDSLGIKPLYYADNGRTLMLSSQVRALRMLDWIDQSPDPAGHVGFMLWGYVPEPYTICRGVRALEAGHFIVAQQDRATTINRYFSLTEEIIVAENLAERHHSTTDEVRDELRSAMVNSVRRHLVSDVPVGVFLSAGLDSNTLVGLATDVRNTEIHTITLGCEEYRGTPNDETGLADSASRYWSSVHTTQWLRREQFESELYRVIESMDQPSVDGLNTYFISKAAVASGLKVALSGLGGDELFGGYDSFRDVPRIVRIFGRCPMPHLGTAMRRLTSPFIRRVTSPKYAGLVEYGSSFAGAYLLRRGLFMPWELSYVLDSELVREGWQELDPIRRLEVSIDGIRTDRLRVSALEITWYMRNQLLRDSDWAGMSHSLEIRVPMVDVDLLRTVARLSTNLHGKTEMAQTPAKPMPTAIMRREKTGFSIPVARWTGNENRESLARGLRGWAVQLSRQFDSSVAPCSLNASPGCPAT